MPYETRDLANRILYYLNLTNVTKATKYMIWDSVRNQLNDYSIKMEDIVITLSDLEDKKLIKDIYYEINKKRKK